MNFIPGSLYHVYNQGNNKQPIFFNRENYIYFLKKMRRHLSGHCDILAWCLMPNHFHWMIRVSENYQFTEFTETSKDLNSKPKVLPLNRSISVLLSSYTKAINKTCGKSGSLFRSRTKAKQLILNDDIDDHYPLICFLYIHQNPFRAGLTSSIEDWEFSSFRDFAGLRNGSVCNIELAKSLLELPDSFEEFISFSKKTIPEHFLDQFRFLDSDN